MHPDASGVKQSWNAFGVGGRMMRLHNALDAEPGLRELVYVGAEWTVVRVCR